MKTQEFQKFAIRASWPGLKVIFLFTADKPFPYNFNFSAYDLLKFR